MGSEIVAQTTQQTRSDVTQVVQSIFRDYSDQLSVTTLAVKHWWIQQYRKTRMAIKDLSDASKQIIAEREPQKRGKGSVIDALADISPLAYEATDKFHLQETYFGISVLVLALTLGGILGNLWTEFAWGPQLSVFQALLVIVMLPVQLYYGFSDLPNPDSIVKRRGQLYLILFFMGFSMGRLCQYTLLGTTPRILPPLAFAYLLDKFDRPRPYGIRRTRLEMFLAVGAFTIWAVWFQLFILRRLTIGAFLISFISASINLQLLFTHFQLYFYGLCTLRERWSMETMKEDEQEDDKEKHHLWTLDNINPWIANADIGYALVVLTLDVLMCVI